MTERKKSTGFETSTLSDFYDRFDEEKRLSIGSGLLELARTKEILIRYLPSPPAVIGDIGGGAGVHALWLARKGYRVHLVDPVLRHIEQANRTSLKQPEYPLASTVVGDAHTLEWEDNSMDALLLLGPLYHLTKREDRIRALKEASRVTKKGGRVFVAVISRFASLMDGIFRHFLDDPVFTRIVEQDLIDGQHRNPTENPAYFTSTFFHHPADVAPEVEESGMKLEKLLAVEGIGGLISDFERSWHDPERRGRLLKFLRAVEDEPSLLGASAHIMAVIKNPADEGRGR